MGKVIKHFDGETTSPTGLVDGAVQNRISDICPSKLTAQHLKKHQDIDVKPNPVVQRYLSEVLQWVQSKPSNKKAIRDDQATMLVLACSTFRDIPTGGLTKMKKFLFYKQETRSHVRWMTTASGYLRLKVFNACQLSESEIASLNSIVKFILNVYVPSFLTIYLNPSAVQGPKVVLKMRDFMKGCGEVALPAKQCFLSHAATWLNPKVAALSLLDDEGPSTHPQRLREPNIDQCLWSNRPITAFMNATSASSPCLTRGSPEDWKSFKNNNMACERLIGQMKYCILNKKSRTLRIIKAMTN